MGTVVSLRLSSLLITAMLSNENNWIKKSVQADIGSFLDSKIVPVTDVKAFLQALHL
jgi:hypothetical protein